MTSKMTSEKCNEPRSEELCGSGRKFQLSWKTKYNWIEYNTDKHRVICSACTNAVKLQMLLTRGAFVPRLKSYLRSTMTQSKDKGEYRICTCMCTARSQTVVL